MEAFCLWNWAAVIALSTRFFHLSDGQHGSCHYDDERLLTNQSQHQHQQSQGSRPGTSSSRSRATGVRPVPDSRIVSTTVAKNKPRLLLMGQRRSGKSSISSVVFHKLPPSETLFLESTARIQKDDMTSFMDIQVWDFPGQIDVFDTAGGAGLYDVDAIFGGMGALIWVIDAQDDYLESVMRLSSTTVELLRLFPTINVEVFIHKVDGLSEDYKLDIKRDIMIRVQDELSDHGIDKAPITYHLTSIYNHSIFEAFSRVIQKLVPHLATLEAMLTNLCRTCHFDKAYLFDLVSKTYIATDSAPADMASYELCSAYIDAILDVAEVYGSWSRSDAARAQAEAPPWNAPLHRQMATPWAESVFVMNDGDKPVMLREVDTYLGLAAVLRTGSYHRMPLINMNVDVTVKALMDFFVITKMKPRPATTGAAGAGAGAGADAVTATTPSGVAATTAPATTAAAATYSHLPHAAAARRQAPRTTGIGSGVMSALNRVARPQPPVLSEHSAVLE